MTLTQLVRLVCREEGVKEAALKDESRARRQSQIRQIITYLAAEFDIASLTALADRFNRDLTTMSRNQRYFRDRLTEDGELQKRGAPPAPAGRRRRRSLSALRGTGPRRTVTDAGTRDGSGEASIEWLDVVDADNRVVGRAPRDVAHRDGLMHRSVHLLLLDGAGRVFVQRRK